MKTYCFIGTDKNAGKTTAFNVVYRKMHEEGDISSVCVTSIGINGESVDEYDGERKPVIRLSRSGLFITEGQHLMAHTGKYETICAFKEPEFSKNFVLGRCIDPFEIILEGPNTGGEILELKRRVKSKLSEGSIFMIDGSIDRQFLASPEISDAFYFSVLFSKRNPQLNKAKAFLYSLTIPVCDGAKKDLVKDAKGAETKTILFDENSSAIYIGEEMPFCDKKLHDLCLDNRDKQITLYLNGALTKNLYNFLAPFENLKVILDNFTQYLNVSVLPGKGRVFRPEITLLNPVRIKKIFVHQETDFDPKLIPGGADAVNLFRKDYNEVRV